MQITLKKALKVRKTLEAELAKTALPVEVSVSVLDKAVRADPMGSIATAGDALLKRFRELERMSEILWRLRGAIAVANAAAGIESNLAKIADIDRMVALHKQIAGAATAVSADEAKEQIELAHARLQDKETMHYGVDRKTVALAVVDPNLKSASEDRIKSLRRDKEALEDERGAINARTTIEIAEEDAGFLREVGVL